MVEVHLWSGLRRLIDGDLVVAVEAATIGEMLEALVAKHPGLEPVIEAGVSVAVDGVVIADAEDVAIGPQNEIYLMQRIKGG